MRPILLILSLALLLPILACGPEGHPAGWKKTDLLPYGLPLTILAPDSVEVKTLNKNSVVQDVSLRKGSDYYVQIFASPAQTTDLARLKADRLAEVRDNPYFKRIVEEQADGFLFEMQIDGTTSYGFRYVIVQGDREYAIQNGLSSLFTEEQARMMYQAVQ